MDGAVASSVRIVDRDFRVGKAVFRLGGIADVATHPDYQKQGYCALLFQEVVAFMAAEGYDLSLLFGIPNFYHRFGYATALVPATLTVSAVHLADLPAAATRPFQEGDLPALSALLEADLEARACAIVRDEALWRYRGVPNALTVVEQEGRPAAYFTAEERKDDLLVRRRWPPACLPRPRLGSRRARLPRAKDHPRAGVRGPPGALPLLAGRAWVVLRAQPRA